MILGPRLFAVTTTHSSPLQESSRSGRPPAATPHTYSLLVATGAPCTLLLHLAHRLAVHWRSRPQQRIHIKVVMVETAVVAKHMNLGKVRRPRAQSMPEDLRHIHAALWARHPHLCGNVQRRHGVPHPPPLQVQRGHFQEQELVFSHQSL